MTIRYKLYNLETMPNDIRIKILKRFTLVNKVDKATWSAAHDLLSYPYGYNGRKSHFCCGFIGNRMIGWSVLTNYYSLERYACWAFVSPHLRKKGYGQKLVHRIFKYGIKMPQGKKVDVYHANVDDWVREVGHATDPHY